MKRWQFITVLAPVMALLLAACGSGEVRNQAPPAGQPSAPLPDTKTGTGALAQSWQTEWQSIITGAKKEGKVTVFSGAGSVARTAIIDAFRQKYGISIEIVVASGPEYSERIQRERRAGIYDVDILITGADTLATILKPAGVFDSLAAALILPEVRDPSAWWSGKPHWVDLEGQYILSALAFPTSAVVYNKNMVKPGEIKSWQDLLDSKWKGKIAMGNPVMPGTTAGVMVGLYDIVGLSWIRGLAANEPVIVRDSRLQVEWVTQGKYPLAFAPSTPVVTEYVQAGAPLELLVPAEGVNVTAGYGNTTLINRAPHPNASKLFLNWFLSKEGATVYSQSTGNQSARLDVSIEGLHPMRLRQPNAKYTWYDDEKVQLQAPQRRAVFKDIFDPLVK